MTVVVVCAYGDKDANGVITPCTQEATCFVRDSNGTSYPCCQVHAPPDPVDGLVVT